MTRLPDDIQNMASRLDAHGSALRGEPDEGFESRVLAAATLGTAPPVRRVGFARYAMAACLLLAGALATVWVVSIGGTTGTPATDAQLAVASLEADVEFLLALDDSVWLPTDAIESAASSAASIESRLSEPWGSVDELSTLWSDSSGEGAI